MSIPNETLHDIFADLPAPVLAVVALACRRFNAVAERLLYSAISVDDVLSERSPNPWRTVRCASSILRRPHLVDAVRSVSVRWRTEEGTLWQPYRDLLAAATHLSSALRTLAFLQTLDIYLGFWSSLSHDGSASWRVMARQTEQLHPIDAIIQSCSFPQLSVCSLHTDWADARGTKDRLDVHVETTPTHALSSFLIASSAQLKHLRLHLPQYSSMGLFSFPSESLRELMSFRGNSRMAAAILPGRPVRSLSLEGREEEVTVEILGQLALTASDNAIGFPHGSAHTEQTLRYLDLSSIPIRPVLLRTIAAQLSDIEVLRIKLALRHTLHYAMSGIRLLTGLSSVLGTFTRLIHLDLSPTSSVTSPTPTPGMSYGSLGEVDEEHALCREWVKVCASLRDIVFPSRRRWTLVVPGDQWVSV